MYNQTQAEINKFQKEYGEQYSAYDEMNVLWKENNETYMPILRLTRVGLKNKSGALHSLRAAGTCKRSVTGFIDDAQMLYNNLLSQPEYLNIISGFGVTEASLNDAKAQLDTLKRCSHKAL